MGRHLNKPQFPTIAFFQPTRNILAMSMMGINTFCGPEVESKSSLPPDVVAAREVEWIQAVAGAGAFCILKRPPAVLPDHCTGILLTPDEPNRANRGPTPELAAEAADFRARYPGTPIYLSLAGDKILSANFARDWERKVYVDFAALYDVAFINFYPRNRNASTYPDTFPGDIVKKLADATGKPVIPFIEANDQRLGTPPNPAHHNRAPTPDEIEAQADWAVKQGAPGLGWFFTCDSGKYGWGTGTPDFATRGDSYLPLVDRNGASMRPQYEAVLTTNVAYAAPPPPGEPEPAPDPVVAELRTRVDVLGATVEAYKQTTQRVIAEQELRVAGLQEMVEAQAKTIGRLREALKE